MAPVTQELIRILTGDVGEILESMASIKDQLTGISDEILFSKFYLFLNSAFHMDQEELRRFSAKLAEKESFQNSFRLLCIIDHIRDLQNVKYISNVTRAFINGFINKEIYFRLCEVIANLLPEDVEFIIANHGKRDLQYTYSAVSLESNQLMYKSVMGKDARCCFLPLEVKLYEYALMYDEDNI